MEGKRRGRQRAREEAVHGRSQNRGPVNGSIHALPVPRLLSLASCLSLTHTPKSYYYLVPPYHCRLRVRLSLPQKPYLGYNAQAQAHKGR